MKSILILSGGLDSTVSSYVAKKETEPVLALTFDYGQRAAHRECEASSKIAKRLNVLHRVIALPWLGELTRTALVSRDVPLPTPQEKDLDDPARNRKSASAVWVPNRNGLFLNVGASFAESLGAQILVTGFNVEEGTTFPDNSAPFVHAANEFFWYSTQGKISVQSFTLHLNKVEIVRQAQELDVPLSEIWFCYEGGEAPCRRCESCVRAFRALREAGLPDPWKKSAR